MSNARLRADARPVERRQAGLVESLPLRYQNGKVGSAEIPRRIVVRNRLLQRFLLLALVGVAGVGMLSPGGIAQAGPFEKDWTSLPAATTDGRWKSSCRRWIIRRGTLSAGVPGGVVQGAGRHGRRRDDLSARTSIGGGVPVWLCRAPGSRCVGEPSAATVSVPFQRRGTAVVLPARINGEAVGPSCWTRGDIYLREPCGRPKTGNPLDRERDSPPGHGQWRDRGAARDTR